jgi:chorismate mutase
MADVKSNNTTLFQKDAALPAASFLLVDHGRRFVMAGNGTGPGEIRVRGVRGATSVGENSEEAILAATRELLLTIIQVNGISPEDVASAHFTTTPDLNATFPAFAARQLGWFDVALLCGHEMDVPGALPRCIRILIHWNTRRGLDEIVHVYLHEARELRPDRQGLPPVPPQEIEQTMALARAIAAERANQ